MRDQLERKKRLILDRPDGYVTYVDYETREVLVNLTRRMGARPQMKMTIFDAESPGIPTEKPKGNIELIASRRTVQLSAASSRPNSNDRSDPRRRHRLLGRLVAQPADAVRPGRQDRRQS